MFLCITSIVLLLWHKWSVNQDTVVWELWHLTGWYHHSVVGQLLLLHIMGTLLTYLLTLCKAGLFWAYSIVKFCYDLAVYATECIRNKSCFLLWVWSNDNSTCQRVYYVTVTTAKWYGFLETLCFLKLCVSRRLFCFLLVLHATPDSLRIDNWGTDVSVGIQLLSGETLLQAKNSTSRRWCLNPGFCR